MNKGMDIFAIIIAIIIAIAMIWWCIVSGALKSAPVLICHKISFMIYLN